MFAADCPTKRAAFMTDIDPGRWIDVPAFFHFDFMDLHVYTVVAIWYSFIFILFSSWRRAKPRTLNRRNRSTVPVHLIDQFGFYLIPTGEVARQFLII